MKKFAKLMVLLPILVGVIIGTVLFMLGNADDAPGLSLIGIVFAFLIIMWGIYNTGIISKRLLVSIIFLCFGAGGILLTTFLLLDGEFGQSPGIEILSIAFGIVFIGIGGAMWQRKKGK